MDGVKDGYAYNAAGSKAQGWATRSRYAAGADMDSRRPGEDLRWSVDGNHGCCVTIPKKQIPKTGCRRWKKLMAGNETGRPDRHRVVG